MKNKGLIISTIALAMAFNVSAKENIGQSGKTGRIQNNMNMLASSCNPATAQTDLDINNVRTTIMTGGDMWWDLISAQYEIPKGGGAHSLFSGALWIGGIDAGGQLKVAAMTYRQTGNDFWPGPLDTTTNSTDQETCEKYDKHFKITRQEVEEFFGWYSNPSEFPNYTVPQSITNWPAHGDQGKKHTQYLAPFYDNNNDGFYNPLDGDFPGYDIFGTSTDCQGQLFGDQTLWWVFNDKGNIHTESQAQSIGLEIHAQAFAFSTNDEINNMTFYNYKIINRSTFAMNETYFGQWVDADLGYYFDDYVGCDVARGLGYCYNGYDVDAQNAGAPGPGEYGANPPAVGVDFFQGPIADPFDNKDNDRDGVKDEPGEQIIMSKFVYYDNDFTVRGNPDQATHFYNYLSGFWKDGLPFTYGGDAYNEGTVVCDFMFPGDSDPTGHGTGGIIQAPWDEESAGNTPHDRRFLQSAGPFTLQPGAVNTITTGVVWARATQGGPMASVELLRVADDKAQALFDNCFKVLNGPDAPDMDIQELDKELILTLSNKPAPYSNNYLETYSEYDPLIIGPDQNIKYDTTYNFEGYVIYQLKDATVSVTDLANPDRARIVAQVDVQNGVTQIVNYDFDPALQATVPREMANGADKGIVHSFKVTEDQFASGDRRLVNHKTYYYMAISYAHNEFIKYKENQPFNPSQPLAPSFFGQTKPYKAGRRNIQVYTAIPHIPSPESGGTGQNSKYGDSPAVTRIEGQGNGGNSLDLTDASVNEVLSLAPFSVANPENGRVRNITYVAGKSPIQVKVVDPLNVPNATFELRMLDSITPNNLDDAYWTLKNTTTGEIVTSDKTIKVANEQVINGSSSVVPQWGISVTISQSLDPGITGATDNGFLEGSMSFADQTKPWLSGLADAEGFNSSNWIRSGTISDATGSPTAAAFNDYSGIDDEGNFEKVLGGTWAPYRLVATTDANNPPVAPGGPGWKLSQMSSNPNQMKELASIDVVITADRTKWTRVPVFEMSDATQLAEGAARKLDPRNRASVDKFGRTVAQGGISDINNPEAADYISGTGMGWFPGYAINLETGERLNMAFGEDSWLAGDNGRDMLWNPTSNVYSFPAFEPVFGGKHYIYVFGHNADGANDIPRYDAGAKIMSLLNVSPPASDLVKRSVFADAMWVNIPLASPGYASEIADGVPPTDAKIRLRVSKSFKKFGTGQKVASGSLVPGQTYYVESGPISHNGVNRAAGTSFVAVDANFTAAASVNPIVLTTVNNADPYYTFSTADLQTVKGDAAMAKDALELINVVPNPYYAYSAYEQNQLDNRIKITNLPEKCTIKIYTLNGTLIRTIKKDENTKTSVDWDLKNTAGIPIASGMYIIHVDVPEVGEKILKWFGVMRPIDLDSF